MIPWSKIFNAKNLLITVLFLPSIGMLQKLSPPPSQDAFESLMHSTGELSVRLLVLTLYISPLLVIFSSYHNIFVRALKWLAQQKRIVGLYAFYYATIHLIAYLLYKNFPKILSDLGETTYIAGWVAFLLLLPLALTSTNFMVRKLGGRKWKNLHRVVYVVALATALHWLTKNGDDGESSIGPVLVHFAPLFLLEVNRYLKYQKKLYHSR